MKSGIRTLAIVFALVCCFTIGIVGDEATNPWVDPPVVDGQPAGFGEFSSGTHQLQCRGGARNSDWDWNLLVEVGIVVEGTITALAALGSPAAAYGPQRQASESDIIQRLLSFDQGLKQEAIDDVLGMDASRRTQELDRALADELSRLNELRRSRWEADRSGKPLTDEFPDEYYRDVAEAVTRSSNVVSLPALAGALGTGRMVQDALVRFGEDAVPHVIDVARSKVGLITMGEAGDVPPHIVADALTTLRLLIEVRPHDLSQQSHADISAVASERLAGGQDGAVVLAACQLAVSTSVPWLRARVERLATSRDELPAMGISDPRWIQMVQRTAQQSLKGR